MNEGDYLKTKEKIHHKCMMLIGEQIDRLTKQLSDLQDAKNNETKSSAGDKYETGRAMIHNQENLIDSQLVTSIRLLNELLQIDPFKKQDVVTTGSLVILHNGIFYISAGLGAVMVDEQRYFALSLKSPLGVAIRNKKSGEPYHFQDKDFIILNVF
ncbi:transcription elongation factor [Nonlabens sp. SCSIO 43208]|uniref:transcription elongation factor n=1 Tax=Nonlabens sp. SCSIO 43208 TaxID=2793009 RepID=UPI003D6AD34B